LNINIKYATTKNSFLQRQYVNITVP